MKVEDFAIIIAISHYIQFPKIRTSMAGGKEVAAWLLDPSGGGLPQENVRSFLDTGEGRPTREDVDKGFDELLKSAKGRRLYIFLSGHGYGTENGDVGLLMADASPQRLGSSIAARAYADFFRDSGKFDEVVLIVDCSSSFPERDFTPPPPPWVKPRFHSSQEPPAFFYAFASAQNSDSFEMTGEEYSLFTGALLKGLSGEAAQLDGRISSQALAEFVKRRVASRLDELGLRMRQVPEFLFNTRGASMLFGSPGLRGTIAPISLPNERVATHGDTPATIDELGRSTFADVIATRIQEVWNARNNDQGGEVGAFMVHIHGRWGSGKTSVLRFLSARLQKVPSEQRMKTPPWLVVDLNAWRYQRIRPPWWTLIREIYIQSARQLGFLSSVPLRACWWFWRIRADWFPVLLALVLAATAVLLLTGLVHFSLKPSAVDKSSRGSSTTSVVPSPATGVAPSPATSVAPSPAASAAPSPATNKVDSSEFAKTVELALKVIVAILAVVGSLVAVSRSLVFGSARAAQTYIDLRSDPLRPIVSIFEKLVNAAGKPIAVLIDDLDRCEGKYVVELLEGIQTLFRTAPITYVVAADRQWICASFEKEYEIFGKPIGEPGRPLGYLFLDKMFQVSVSVPRPLPDMKRKYWESLLSAPSDTSKVKEQEKRELAKNKALDTAKHEGAYTYEALQKLIDEVRNDPIQEQAMRAAAAEQITSPEAAKRTEHRLQKFEHLLEANPRSMKRLVNAFGLHQATQLLEGRRVSPEALARWTIIEMRWPLLADFLNSHPEAVVALAKGKVLTDLQNMAAPEKSEGLKELYEDAEVKAVLAYGSIGEMALDERSIRQIIGAL